VKVFGLPTNLENPEICPVNTLLRYVEVLEREALTGPLFKSLKLVKGDVHNCLVRSSPMPYKFFQDTLLPRVMQMISVDPAGYGTHSFRRGGAQFLNQYWAVPTRAIALWAGWSSGKNDALNYTMIVRYMTNPDEDTTDYDSLLFPENRNKFLRRTDTLIGNHPIMMNKH
jgi:hypothetical protein